MSYFAATFFALSYFVAYLYVGPIACVPFVYWFVFGGFVAPNGREPIKFSIAFVIIFVAIISTVGWYTTKYLIDAKILNEWLKYLAGIAEIKSTYVSAIDLALAKEAAGVRQCSRCFDLFGLGIYSNLMVSTFLAMYLRRVHSVRESMSKLFSRKPDNIEDNSGCFVIALILFIPLILIAGYWGFDLDQQSIEQLIRRRQLNRLGPIIIPTILPILFLVLFMQIKKFSEHLEEDK